MSRVNSEIAYESFERFSSALVQASVKLPEVGGRIKLIRKSLGMEQKEFGLKIGAGQSAISRYENGIHITENPDVLVKIAALDPQKRGVEWLLGGDEALQAVRVIHVAAPGAPDVLMHQALFQQLRELFTIHPEWEDVIRRQSELARKTATRQKNAERAKNRQSGAVSKTDKEDEAASNSQ